MMKFLGERRQEKQLLLYPRACPYCRLLTHQFEHFSSPGDDRNINGKCIFRTATDPTNKSPPSSTKHPYSISQTSITHLLVRPRCNIHEDRFRLKSICVSPHSFCPSWTALSLVIRWYETITSARPLPHSYADVPPRHSKSRARHTCSTKAQLRLLPPCPPAGIDEGFSIFLAPPWHGRKISDSPVFCDVAKPLIGSYCQALAKRHLSASIIVTKRAAQNPPATQHRNPTLHGCISPAQHGKRSTVSPDVITALSLDMQWVHWAPSPLGMCRELKT